MPLEIQQQNLTEGSEVEEIEQGGWNDSWAWAATPGQRSLAERVNKKGFDEKSMKRGMGEQIWVSKQGWEMSRKIYIGWDGGKWGTEVRATLSRQISHTVFACAQLV